MSQAGDTDVLNSHPTIPTQFVTDSGTAVPAANILNVLGGTGIETSGSGNTIIITNTGAGFTWHVVTSADNPVSLVAGNGYIPKGGSAVNFKLPAAASVGDTFKIVGYGNLWTLAQNAGQSITVGNKTSTVGAGGSVSATMISDGIEILCVTANTEFYSDGSVQGNLTIA